MVPFWLSTVYAIAPRHALFQDGSAPVGTDIKKRFAEGARFYALSIRGMKAAQHISTFVANLFRTTPSSEVLLGNALF
jgi:hypothetical protein